MQVKIVAITLFIDIVYGIRLLSQITEAIGQTFLAVNRVWTAPEFLARHSGCNDSST